MQVIVSSIYSSTWTVNSPKPQLANKNPTVFDVEAKVCTMPTLLSGLFVCFSNIAIKYYFGTS